MGKQCGHGAGLKVFGGRGTKGVRGEHATWVQCLQGAYGEGAGTWDELGRGAAINQGEEVVAVVVYCIHAAVGSPPSQRIALRAVHAPTAEQIAFKTDHRSQLPPVIRCVQLQHCLFEI